MDRIDFEELALKGIDPSLGPSILHPDISGKESTSLKDPVAVSVFVPFSFPHLTSDLIANSLAYIDPTCLPTFNIQWFSNTR